jgi:hypothetical protein
MPLMMKLSFLWDIFDIERIIEDKIAYLDLLD